MKTGSRGRLVRTGAAVLLAVGVLAANAAVPDWQRKYRPLATRGTVDEVVNAGPFTMRVDRVELARSLASGSLTGSGQLPTPGIWVVVWARMKVHEEPTSASSVALLTRDGHRYRASDRPDLQRLLNEQSLEPGIGRYGAFVFEIPPERLAGARLLVSTALVPTLGPQARIDLGLDAERLAGMVEHAPRGYELSEVGFR